MAGFVLRYTASVGFDQRLALADIEGSLAHARMLGATGILAPAPWKASSGALLRPHGER